MGVQMMKQGNGSKKILKKSKKIWAYEIFASYLQMRERNFHLFVLKSFCLIHLFKKKDGFFDNFLIQHYIYI